MNILAPAPPPEIMQAFDSLPHCVRKALAFADFPFDPRQISERLARGRRAEVIARSIEMQRTMP
jgi:hypothetical protein